MFKKAFSAHVVVGLLAGLSASTAGISSARAGDAPAPKTATSPAATPAASTPATAATAVPAAKPPAPPTKKQRDAARKAYAEGEKAFAAGDYAAAAAAFQRANENIPAPQAEYWRAKSLDSQNKTEDAISAYEAFLANPDAAKAGDAKVEDAKTRLDALRATLVAEVVIETAPSPATVTVDGAPQNYEFPLVLKLTPGKHRVSVTAPGYLPKDVDLDVKGGDKLKQQVELVKEPAPAPAALPPPPPPAPAPAPPPPEPRSMVPAYVTLGIAGAAAVVGTIFGVQALSAKSDFDKTPNTDKADDTERNALIADMAFGVAITLGVTGVVLLTSDDDPPASSAASAPKLKRARLDLIPYGGPKSGGANARLTF
jgi:hypothetical protein